MSEIVLLGDSIFDNAPYVGSGGKAVIEYLRSSTEVFTTSVLVKIDSQKPHDLLTANRSISLPNKQS